MKEINWNRCIQIVAEGPNHKVTALLLLYLLGCPGHQAHTPTQELAQTLGVADSSLRRALHGLQDRGFLVWYKGTKTRLPFISIIDPNIIIERPDPPIFDTHAPYIPQEAWEEAVRSAVETLQRYMPHLSGKNATSFAISLYLPITLLALVEQLVRECRTWLIRHTKEMVAPRLAAIQALMAQSYESGPFP